MPILFVATVKPLIFIPNLNKDLAYSQWVRSIVRQRRPFRRKIFFSPLFSFLLISHGSALWWTKDGPIARFIAALKRTYLLRFSLQPRQIELTLELRNFVASCSSNWPRNRCNSTCFLNAPSNPFHPLPPPCPTTFVFHFLANFIRLSRTWQMSRRHRNSRVVIHIEWNFLTKIFWCVWNRERCKWRNMTIWN